MNSKKEQEFIDNAENSHSYDDFSAALRLSIRFSFNNNEGGQWVCRGREL